MQIIDLYYNVLDFISFIINYEYDEESQYAMFI